MGINGCFCRVSLIFKSFSRRTPVRLMTDFSINNQQFKIKYPINKLAPTKDTDLYNILSGLFFSCIIVYSLLKKHNKLFTYFWTSFNTPQKTPNLHHQKPSLTKQYFTTKHNNYTSIEFLYFYPY